MKTKGNIAVKILSFVSERVIMAASGAIQQTRCGEFMSFREIIL